MLENEVSVLLNTELYEKIETERSNATAERTVQCLQDSVQYSSSQYVVSATTPDGSWICTSQETV